MALGVVEVDDTSVFSFFFPSEWLRIFHECIYSI